MGEFWNNEQAEVLKKHSLLDIHDRSDDQQLLFDCLPGKLRKKQGRTSSEY